jgi:hypothetical protein
MTVSAEYLEALCENASEAARDRGHELEAWMAPPGEDAIARAAVCVRCGRVAYVRAESGFFGAAGDALVQPCAAPLDDVER